MTLATEIASYFTVWAGRSGTVAQVTVPEREKAVALGAQEATERFGADQDGDDELVNLYGFLEAVKVLAVLTTVKLEPNDERWVEELTKRFDSLYKRRFQAELKPHQKRRKDDPRLHRMYPFME